MPADRSSPPTNDYVSVRLPPVFRLWHPTTWLNARKAWLLIFGGVLAAAAWTGAVWFAVSWDLQRRQTEEIRHMTDVATLSALALSENLDRRLEALRTVPKFAAHVPNHIALLLEANRTTFDGRTDARGIEIAGRYDEFIRRGILQGVFLLTAKGRCIMAATRRAEARAACWRDGNVLLRLPPPGDIGFGVLAGRPSLFDVEPVIDRGRTVGWVVAQIEMAFIGKNLVDADAFVTDRNGVVVLARNPDLWSRTLPGAPVYRLSAEERLLRYGRRDFLPLPMAPVPGAPGQVLWSGEAFPSLLVTRSYRGGLLSVHITRPLTRLRKIRQDRLWVFGAFWLLGILGGTLVWGGLLVLDQTKRYNREISRLNDVLARQASTDELTGIANRRQFFATLEAERQRGLRHGTHFAVLEIDFDHFKAINDRWGHAIGDKALSHVVSVLRETIRAEDVPARLGGDEFAVMLPETDAAQAALAAGRICAAVAETPLVLDAAQLTLSLSIGVAQWYPEAPETVAQTLSRADKALYLAKEAGRGRVQPEISPLDDRPPELA